MYRLLDYLSGPKVTKKQVPYKCAFIPQTILEHVAHAEGVSEQVRQSCRSTIAASKETVKEREEVADHEKNPHEPRLPASDKSGLRSTDEPTCATVDIHDGLNSDYTELPGPLRRKYGQDPIADQVVNDCYDMMNKAQSFFRDVYGWDSIDDKNVPLIATVHHGWNVANAFFIAEHNQMVFGNGNDHMYGFVRSLEVVGHELTHGIIQHSSGMIYWSQSGALNEHCSDVFGTLLEQYERNQTADEADWLLAQDVLFPDDPKVAMRSFKAPGTAFDDPRVGKDKQRAHAKDYYEGEDDNYGVHINSGMCNRAFYLAATRHGGHAWETPGKTWFAAMTTFKTYGSFGEFALHTIEEAKKHVDPGFASIVGQAWIDVGILDAEPKSWFGWMRGQKGLVSKLPPLPPLPRRRSRA